jgi:opacity protein-like surface antigen
LGWEGPEESKPAAQLPGVHRAKLPHGAAESRFGCVRLAQNANELFGSMLPLPFDGPLGRFGETNMLARAVLAAALLWFSAAASAVTIDSVGDSFTVDFAGSAGNGTEPGLTARASFLVAEFDAATGHVVLEITLTNTTDASIWESSRVSAIGFNTDHEIASASSSGVFSQAVMGGRFPGIRGLLDVCAVDNPNNCSGGGNGGVTIGQSGVVTMTLEFGGPISSLDLSRFVVRYQSLNSEELEICDDSGVGEGVVVPEPRLLALLGVAGLAIVGSRKRAA